MIFVRLISCFVLLLSASVLAAADLPIQNYHNARVIFQSNADADEYLLALGSYKKIAGSWRVDRQQRLSGRLARYTLELPEGHSASNGFDFYLDQLQNFNFRELYHCNGRDCGTSNSWANNHFKIQLLYGLDQFQQYGAYEVTTADETPFYVALYAVQRGNKRVYLQLDVLHVDSVIELGIASSPESIIKSLLASGYYVFPDFVAGDTKNHANINIKPAHIQALIDVLTQRPDWKVALVGHDYAPVPLAQQQKNSQGYAEQLSAALQEKGIAAKRVAAYGIGSLAPAGRGDRSARVEVVKVSD
ncbi:DUF4892 domain-containing protein [Cellvibrio sp. OA-2007]|uniref:DUF4892 domain-containing protein n=1 Tax=Cellvibrio sp. OA-2007 TaxID=529823 RepID=UPI000784D01D|nr:DUF4892 domain-containing protein [Cellvibrio sp. OA-2007]